MHNDEGDDNNGQNNEVVFLALSVLATLTGLCMVMAATFLAASGWMRRSRWARIKKEPNQHKALWKRRRIVANGPAHNGKTCTSACNLSAMTFAIKTMQSNSKHLISL